VIFEKQRQANAETLASMKTSFLTAVATGLLLSPCGEETGSSGKARSLLGKWMCVAATVDGKLLPEKTVQELQLTITRERYTTMKGTETLFDSTYRLNTAVSPTRIYLLGNEGDLTGKEAEGIVSLETDTLIICYTMPAYPPPTKFVSSPGSKAYLVSWRRVTP